MGLIQNIKDKVAELSAKQKESKEFKKMVDSQTKPIRRAGYLKESLKNAFKEGQLIAQKELAKKEEKLVEKKPEDFFKIPDMNLGQPKSSKINKSKEKKTNGS